MKTYSITLSGEEAAMLDELTDILGSEDAAVGRAIRYLEEHIVPGKVNIKSYYDKDKYLRTSAADRKAKEAAEANPLLMKAREFAADEYAVDDRDREDFMTGRMDDDDRVQIAYTILFRLEGKK